MWLEEVEPSKRSCEAPHNTPSKSVTVVLTEHAELTNHVIDERVHSNADGSDNESIHSSDDLYSGDESPSDFVDVIPICGSPVDGSASQSPVSSEHESGHISELNMNGDAAGYVSFAVDGSPLKDKCDLEMSNIGDAHVPAEQSSNEPHASSDIGSNSPASGSSDDGSNSSVSDSSNIGSSDNGSISSASDSSDSSSESSADEYSDNDEENSIKATSENDQRASNNATRAKPSPNCVSLESENMKTTSVDALDFQTTGDVNNTNQKSDTGVNSDSDRGESDATSENDTAINSDDLSENDKAEVTPSGVIDSGPVNVRTVIDSSEPMDFDDASDHYLSGNENMNIYDTTSCSSLTPSESESDHDKLPTKETMYFDTDSLNKKEQANDLNLQPACSKSEHEHVNETSDTGSHRDSDPCRDQANICLETSASVEARKPKKLTPPLSKISLHLAKKLPSQGPKKLSPPLQSPNILPKNKKCLSRQQRSEAAQRRLVSKNTSGDSSADESDDEKSSAQKQGKSKNIRVKRTKKLKSGSDEAMDTTCNKESPACQEEPRKSQEIPHVNSTTQPRINTSDGIEVPRGTPEPKLTKLEELARLKEEAAKKLQQLKVQNSGARLEKPKSETTHVSSTNTIVRTDGAHEIIDVLTSENKKLAPRNKLPSKTAVVEKQRKCESVPNDTINKDPRVLLDNQKSNVTESLTINKGQRTASRNESCKELKTFQDCQTAIDTSKSSNLSVPNSIPKKESSQIRDASEPVKKPTKRLNENENIMLTSSKSTNVKASHSKCLPIKTQKGTSKDGDHVHSKTKDESSSNDGSKDRDTTKSENNRTSAAEQKPKSNVASRPQSKTLPMPNQKGNRDSHGKEKSEQGSSSKNKEINNSSNPPTASKPCISKEPHDEKTKHATSKIARKAPSVVSNKTKEPSLVENKHHSKVAKNSKDIPSLLNAKVDRHELSHTKRPRQEDRDVSKSKRPTAESRHRSHIKRNTHQIPSLLDVNVDRRRSRREKRGVSTCILRQLQVEREMHQGRHHVGRNESSLNDRPLRNNYAPPNLHAQVTDYNHGYASSGSDVAAQEELRQRNQEFIPSHHLPPTSDLLPPPRNQPRVHNEHPATTRPDMRLLRDDNQQSQLDIAATRADMPLFRDSSQPSQVAPPPPPRNQPRAHNEYPSTARPDMPLFRDYNQPSQVDIASIAAKRPDMPIIRESFQPSMNITAPLPKNNFHSQMAEDYTSPVERPDMQAPTETEIPDKNTEVIDMDLDNSGSFNQPLVMDYDHGIQNPLGVNVVDYVHGNVDVSFQTPNTPVCDLPANRSDVSYHNEPQLHVSFGQANMQTACHVPNNQTQPPLQLQSPPLIPQDHPVRHDPPHLRPHVPSSSEPPIPQEPPLPRDPPPSRPRLPSSNQKSAEVQESAPAIIRSEQPKSTGNLDTVEVKDIEFYKRKLAATSDEKEVEYLLDQIMKLKMDSLKRETQPESREHIQDTSSKLRTDIVSNAASRKVLRPEDIHHSPHPIKTNDGSWRRPSLAEPPSPTKPESVAPKLPDQSARKQQIKAIPLKVDPHLPADDHPTDPRKRLNESPKIKAGIVTMDYNVFPWSPKKAKKALTKPGMNIEKTIDKVQIKHPLNSEKDKQISQSDCMRQAEKKTSRKRSLGYGDAGVQVTPISPDQEEHVDSALIKQRKERRRSLKVGNTVNHKHRLKIRDGVRDQLTIKVRGIITSSDKKTGVSLSSVNTATSKQEVEDVIDLCDDSDTDSGGTDKNMKRDTPSTNTAQQKNSDDKHQIKEETKRIKRPVNPTGSLKSSRKSPANSPSKTRDNLTVKKTDTVTEQKKSTGSKDKQQKYVEKGISLSLTTSSKEKHLRVEKEASKRKKTKSGKVGSPKKAAKLTKTMQVTSRSGGERKRPSDCHVVHSPKKKERRDEASNQIVDQKVEKAAETQVMQDIEMLVRSRQHHKGEGTESSRADGHKVTNDRNHESEAERAFRRQQDILQLRSRLHKLEYQNKRETSSHSSHRVDHHSRPSRGPPRGRGRGRGRHNVNYHRPLNDDRREPLNIPLNDRSHFSDYDRPHPHYRNQSNRDRSQYHDHGHPHYRDYADRPHIRDRGDRDLPHDDRTYFRDYDIRWR